MTRSIGLEITGILWVIASLLAKTELQSWLCIAFAVWQFLAAYSAHRQEQRGAR